MYLGIEKRVRGGRDRSPEAGRTHTVEATRPGNPAGKKDKAPARETGTWSRFEENQRLLNELLLHQAGQERLNEEMSLASREDRSTQEKYRALFEHAPVCYLTLGRDGIIRSVNTLGSNLLGIERSRLVGRRFELFVAREARSAFSYFLGKVFAGQHIGTCRVPLIKSGKRPSDVQIETVAAASGEECYAVIIDISARIGMEAELERQCADLASRVADLEDANRELEAFNFTVSHDLCTPLTTISGFSEILAARCREQLDEQSQGYLQGICIGTVRMKQLIGSLLDFSRVTRVALSRESVDLSAMAKAVAEELRQAEPDGRVSFRAREGISVNGDAGLCRIVLANLIGNAWKHSGTGVDTVIEFGMSELAGKPVYFVCDNGPGFDMADAAKLFIPFQRITGVNAEGHGIGLATVKRIVKRHGGRVWAESSPGEGATFFFTLE